MKICFFFLPEIKVHIYTEEYELGRKHLANMIGIHPDEMTKDHINASVIFKITYMYQRL
jgi:hypothetical protein